MANDTKDSNRLLTGNEIYELTRGKYGEKTAQISKTIYETGAQVLYQKYEEGFSDNSVEDLLSEEED